MINLLANLKVDKTEEEKVLSELMGIVDEMEEWDYSFVMDMADNNWISEKQYAIVKQLYYKYFERYM